MKKALTSVLVLALLMNIFAGCSKQEVAPATNETTEVKTYEIKLGYGTNPGHPIDLASVKFEEEVEKKAAAAGYSVDVQLFPSAQLGSEKEMVEQLQTGSIDIVPTTTGPLGLFEPKFFLFDLPYIFLNYDHADATLDGEVGTEILASLESKGILGLAWWENGFRQLTNNKREIKAPSDLKGIKLRTMQNDVHIDYFKNLGASPTPLGFGEIYTSLQSGVIDGQENPFSIIATNNFHEVQPFVTQSDHVYSPVAVLASAAFMKELPEELQKIVKDTAFELRLYQRETGRAQQNYYINKIKEKSAIYVLSDEEKKAFQEAAYPTYKKFENKIGVELIKKIVANY